MEGNRTVTFKFLYAILGVVGFPYFLSHMVDAIWIRPDVYRASSSDDLRLIALAVLVVMDIFFIIEALNNEDTFSMIMEKFLTRPVEWFVALKFPGLMLGFGLVGFLTQTTRPMFSVLVGLLLQDFHFGVFVHLTLLICFTGFGLMRLFIFYPWWGK